MQELSAFVESERKEKERTNLTSAKSKISHAQPATNIYIIYTYIFFVKCIFMTIHVCF